MNTRTLRRGQRVPRSLSDLLAGCFQVQALVHRARCFQRHAMEFSLQSQCGRNPQLCGRNPHLQGCSRRWRHEVRRHRRRSAARALVCLRRGRPHRRPLASSCRARQRRAPLSKGGVPRPVRHQLHLPAQEPCQWRPPASSWQHLTCCPPAPASWRQSQARPQTAMPAPGWRVGRPWQLAKMPYLKQCCSSSTG